ncbi:MAG: DNA polymerase III subunit gamma/tau [Planctomycetia bacterium]|nr:DNA polymerase III subunit gamma/tau [Planctomycetia bacterium]
MSDLLPETDPESADRAAAAAPAGEYVVVARRYRPQAFAELVGQQHVAQALSGAIHSHRVGHAYLFTGARGVGKTSTARIFAKALNCEQGPTDTPCNECDICRSITSGDDVDVIEIDGASNRGIDDIRQLRQNVNVRPSRARFKIYIIDEVHMLSRDAFNALLKTLEEPPEHVKFMFCTTEPEKIPITILSRCQRFDFAGVETSMIAERLRQITEIEGVEVEAEALELLARRAAGSMRDSQSLLEQILAAGGKRVTTDDVQRLLGIATDARLTKLVECLMSRNAAGALAELDGAVRQGVEVGQMLDQLLGYLRDLLAAAVGCPSTSFLYVTPSRAIDVAKAGPQIGVHTLLAMLQIVEQAAGRLKQSTASRTLVEIALVRICCLDDLDDLGTLIAQLSTGGAGGMVVAPGPRPTPVAGQLGNSGISGRQSPPSSPEDNEALKKNVESVIAPVSEAPAPSLPSPKPVEAKPAERSNGQAHAAQIEPASAPIQAPSGVSQTSKPSEVALPHPTSADLRKAWDRMIDEFRNMLGDHAEKCETLAFFVPNRLVASFPKKYNLSKVQCERPDSVSRINEAMTKSVGRPLRLECVLLEDRGGAETKKDAPRGPTQHEKLREKTQQPFVRQALELFDARLIRLEEDKDQ